MWKWLERKLFRRLEMRLSAELDGRFERLQSHVLAEGREGRERGRMILAHTVDVLDQLEQIVEALHRVDRWGAEVLTTAKTAADVRQVAMAADHAAKLEQLSRNVSQVIALQFGKTTDSFTKELPRPPRDFDNDHRQ